VHGVGVVHRDDVAVKGNSAVIGENRSGGIPVQVSVGFEASFGGAPNSSGEAAIDTVVQLRGFGIAWRSLASQVVEDRLQGPVAPVVGNKIDIIKEASGFDMPEFGGNVAAPGDDEDLLTIIGLCRTGGAKGPCKAAGKGDGKAYEFRLFRVLVPGVFKEGLIEGVQDIAIQGGGGQGEAADAGGQGVGVFNEGKGGVQDYGDKVRQVRQHGAGEDRCLVGKYGKIMGRKKRLRPWPRGEGVVAEGEDVGILPVFTLQKGN